MPPSLIGGWITDLRTTRQNHRQTWPCHIGVRHQEAKRLSGEANLNIINLSSVTWSESIEMSP